MTRTITFTDGDAYERYMGVWSQLVGEKYLDWLNPAQGLRWLDVGCGNGAFTETLANRCAPAAIDGIDPSEAQLEFARTRPALRLARFRKGDAMALPYASHSFDIAVMPLVIFFVPEPAHGVAEMCRVVRPGGTVTAYGWDLQGSGFPYQLVREALLALGAEVPWPPRPEAAGLENLHALWQGSGLTSIETVTLSVERSYPDFETYWKIVQGGPSVASVLAALPEAAQAQLQDRLRATLPRDAEGRIRYAARANAVKGVVAG